MLFYWGVIKLINPVVDTHIRLTARKLTISVKCKPFLVILNVLWLQDPFMFNFVPIVLLSRQVQQIVVITGSPSSLLEHILLNVYINIKEYIHTFGF